jgi:hypothetical protein
MRLRLVFALAALAALAACDQAGGPKGSARAPIGAAPPAKTAAAAPAAAPAANCPTMAPACPTPGVARHKAKAVHHKAAAPAPRTYRTFTTATLPPARAEHHYGRRHAHRQDGLPDRPYRYDELDHGEATIILPYGDDYADRPHHGHHRWNRQETYGEHRGGGEPMNHGYRRDDRADEDARYEQRRAEYESRRHDESSTRSSGYSGGRYEHHAYMAPPPPAPPPPPPSPPPPPPRYEGHSQSYSGYGQSSGGYERREYRSYSEQSSSQSSSSSTQGGCCQPAGSAAGFDSRGFLTWPGKTPR